MVIEPKKCKTNCDTVKHRSGKRKLDDNCSVVIEPKKMNTDATGSAIGVLTKPSPTGDDVQIIENYYSSTKKQLTIFSL